jgi:hypothetical protein
MEANARGMKYAERLLRRYRTRSTAAVQLCKIFPQLQKAGAVRGGEENQKHKVLPGRVPENLPEPQPVPVDYQRL